MLRTAQTAGPAQAHQYAKYNLPTLQVWYSATITKWNPNNLEQRIFVEGLWPTETSLFLLT